MNPYFENKDAELVEMTLVGNTAAYEELVTRHERAVKGTAMKVTKNEFSAEDASQDAFVAAWMNLDSLREKDRFGSWVCAIAKNCARTLQVKYKSTVPDISLDLLTDKDLYDSTEKDLAELLEIQDDSALLHQKINALNEKIRETVTMHYFQNLSVHEIAEKLNIPQGTVKWRLSEGRKQLRKGFGIMEKDYQENEPLVKRVMRQVDALKLWNMKNSKEGFESAYKEVLAAVEALDNSKEKSHMLADVWQLSYWWVPGQHNDEVLLKIKQAAEEGHNDSVMETVVACDLDDYDEQAKIDRIEEYWVPYLTKYNFRKSLGHAYFWMGYEYRSMSQYDKALESYQKTMEVTKPEDSYYAAAKSGLLAETWLQENTVEGEDKPKINVVAETFQKVDGKWYFATQPGYGQGYFQYDISPFYDASRCDGILYDPTMQVGDKKVASDGKTELCFTKSGETAETPAGIFQNCDVFTVIRQDSETPKVKSWFCKGYGIVKQELTLESGETYTCALTDATVHDGDGMTAFVSGNRLVYSVLQDGISIRLDAKTVSEVTYAKDGKAVLSCATCVKVLGYLDDWKGNILKAKNEYFDHEDRLVDVKPALLRAEELAKTPRQKRHAAIAKDVMCRILDTDPTFNPDYREKGKWNFFSYYKITAENGETKLSGDIRDYSFEWKSFDEGEHALPILYNFLYDILQDATGYLWNPAWCDGFCFGQEKKGKKTEGKVENAGTVTAKAGTFADCYAVTFTREGLRGGLAYRGGAFTYYFAPKIGIVKMVHPTKFYGDIVWELTSYTGEGTGYFPIADGFVRRYAPTSLPTGYHASVTYTCDVENGDIVLFRNALGTKDRI